MKDLKEILEEVKKQCIADNCQSLNVITIIAMKEAIKEYREDIFNKVKELIGHYVSEDSLNNFINDLENED
jgi:2C-methyl-D-erythritol 2,4-cyclodiphosphate synthase